MAICQKRRDEFISLLKTWYEMNWDCYFDLSDVQDKMRQVFEVFINFFENSLIDIKILSFIG